jgi:hypothetical protein
MIRVEAAFAGRLRGWALYCLGVLILLGFLAGWLFAIAGAVEVSQIEAARSWPARKAVITHSYARQVRGFQSQLYWHAEITGEYIDDGRTFGVRRHAYGIENSVNTRGAAEALVRKYPVGTRLDVYPEPGNPRNAILEPQASAVLTWATLWSGVALILLPFALYARGRLRRKGRQR